MVRIRLLLLLLSLLFSSLIVKAQTKTITGTVTSSGNNSPMPGVSVLVKGTQNGTITDQNGQYVLKNVPGDAILVFSSISYQSQEVQINGRDQINIRLKHNVSSLDQVVVIGYGTQKKVNLTGAISTIDSKSLENRGTTNLSEALQGQVPGLQVIRTSGQPGQQAISLAIRGKSTFTDNPPLVIIDGIPSSIDRINPEDIESISVLKDAASAAIYGARAAGGVILITTKSGKKGKPQIKYSGYVGIEKVTRLPEKVTAYEHAKLFREAQLNDNPNTTAFKFSEADLARYSSPDWHDYDRYDVIFRKGFQTKHTISVSGGTDRQNYYLSLGYLNQEGIVINTGYKRFNTRYNQSIKLGKKIKVDLKASYSPSEAIAPSEANYPGGPARGLHNLISWGVYRRGKYLPIFAPNGKWASVEGVANVIGLASKEGGQEKLISNRASGNISIDYNILKNLTLSAKYGINFTQNRQKDYSKRMKFYDPNEPNSVDVYVNNNALLEQKSSFKYHSAKFLVNYNGNIGDNEFSVLAGYSREYSYNENTIVGRTNFITDNIYAISAGSGNPINWTTGGGMSDWALASYIARASYSFKSKYLVNASMRYDGSSRFIKEHRWGFFPSISLGWRLTEEEFLRNSKVFTFLKLRASWGHVGNQNVGNYPFASTLSTGSYYFNGLPQKTVYPSGSPNKNLTWEDKTAIDIGLDGNILGNLLGFAIDVFKDRTKGILLTLPVPTTFGRSAPVQNAGIVDNYGWEVQLTHQNTLHNFKYGISIQISNATNKVVDLAGKGPWIIGNTISEKGHSMKEWYGLKAKGFFQTEAEVKAHPFQNVQTGPGDIRYQENGGDPNTINANDRVRLGSSDINFPYGIKLNFSYKSFDFAAFGQGVLKHKVWVNGWTAFNIDRAQATLFTYMLNRWTPQTPHALFPKTRVDGINEQFSSYWLQNGAYFRLKNIQIGWSLPKTFLNKLKLQKARIYISAHDLFTVTELLGFDPEIATGTSSRLVEGRYPFSKVFYFGLNLTF